MCNYFITKKMAIIISALFCIFMSFTTVLGIDSSLLESKILRGNDVNEHDMKYAAAIRIHGVFTCTGFIVSYFCVTYAIKCTHGKDTAFKIRDFKTDVKVEVGTKTLSGNNVRQILYINYLSDTYNSNNDFSPADIGVITLRSSLVDVINVEKASFATEDTSITGRIIIAGWENVKISFGCDVMKLKSLNLLLVNNAECSGIYGIPLDSNNYICGRTLENQGIATQNDVGSPLIYSNLVIGVLSYVPPPTQRHPLVFTKISTYSSFVQKEINTADENDEKCTAADYLSESPEHSGRPSRWAPIDTDSDNSD